MDTKARQLGIQYKKTRYNSYLDFQHVCNGMGLYKHLSALHQKGIHKYLMASIRDDSEDQANARLCSRWHGEDPSCVIPEQPITINDMLFLKQIAYSFFQIL